METTASNSSTRIWECQQHHNSVTVEGNGPRVRVRCNSCTPWWQRLLGLGYHTI